MHAVGANRPDVRRGRLPLPFAAPVPRERTPRGSRRRRSRRMAWRGMRGDCGPRAPDPTIRPPHFRAARTCRLRASPRRRCDSHRSHRTSGEVKLVSGRAFAAVYARWKTGCHVCGRHISRRRGYHARSRAARHRRADSATGVPPEIAAFQARSAFSGAGFTTTEAENVVNHPARRRIIATTMFAGSLGTPTLVVTVLLGFVAPSGARFHHRTYPRAAFWCLPHRGQRAQQGGAELACRRRQPLHRVRSDRPLGVAQRRSCRWVTGS